MFASMGAKIIAGASLLTVLIVIAPALFGEGYTSVVALAYGKPENLFAGSPIRSFFVAHADMWGMAVLGGALIKVFAVSLTLNAGGNGGNFAPSLLVGGCTGFAFAHTGNLLGIGHL